MDAFIKNVVYLTPPAGLAFAGLGCIWAVIGANEIFLRIVFLAVAGSLFYGAFVLGKFGYESLERIAATEAKAKIEVEREKTSRKNLGHNQDLQKIEARKMFGQEKFTHGIIREIAKKL